MGTSGELYVLDNLGRLQSYVRGLNKETYDGLVSEFCRIGDYPFNDITTMASNIDMMIEENYFNRELFPQYNTNVTQSCDISVSTARASVQTYLLANKYRFGKIIATMTAEYDPVSNYDLTETEQIDRDYLKTNDNSERVVTSNIGERKGEAKNGKIEGQNTTGAYSDTNEIGPRTTTESVAPFDSANMNPKNESVTGKTTDKTTHTQRTDNYSQEAVTNNVTQNAAVDKTIQDGTNDTELMDDKTVRKLTRKGNIGVMTAAQMIEGERKIAQINLASMVAKEIADILCVGYYCLDI